MQLQLDTLKCVKMLEGSGFERPRAEGLIQTLTSVDLINLYSKQEIDTMLSEAVEKVFEKFDKQFDRRLEAYERRTTIEIAEIKAEAKANRRWVMGTIITVGFALAGYLSALIHTTH